MLRKWLLKQLGGAEEEAEKDHAAAASRKDQSQPEDPTDPAVLNRLRYAILRCLFGAMVVGAVAGVLPALVNAEFTSAMTVLLWVLACLASGLITGFLFAIPKVLQGYRSESEGMTGRQTIRNQETKVERTVSTSARSELPYSLQVNTNLEQISDWLCKIIVGLGLIELRRIPDAVGELSRNLAMDLGAGLTPSFAGGVIVYFAVVGFLFGYIGTRLLLAGEFGRADRDAVWGAERERFEQKMDERLKEQLDDLDARMASMSGRLALNSGEEQGSASFEFAVKELKQAHQLRPAHRRAAMTLSALYYKAGNYKEAADVLDETLRAKMDQGTGRDADAGDLHFNRAACHYRIFKQADTDPKREEARAKTVESVKLALELNPANQQERLSDADWQDIAADPVFRTLFASPGSPPPSPDRAGENSDR